MTNLDGFFTEQLEPWEAQQMLLTLAPDDMNATRAIPTVTVAKPAPRQPIQEVLVVFPRCGRSFTRWVKDGLIKLWTS